MTHLGGLRDERKAVIAGHRGLAALSSRIRDLANRSARGWADRIPALRAAGAPAERPRHRAANRVAVECERDGMRLAVIDNDVLHLRAITRGRQPRQRDVLPGLCARTASFRRADRTGLSAAAAAGHGKPAHPSRTACGRSRSRPTARRSSTRTTSRRRPQADRRRSVVVLPVRLLLDEHEAGRPLPINHGASEAARRARASAARIPGTDGRTGRGGCDRGSQR